MMKYKKIYIEITNVCNLSCSFCPKHHRKNDFMSLENFEKILDKINDYTDYIYLHVMGEALLHPNFKEIVELANKKGFFVQLTTNGYLTQKIDENTSLRQINVSLHSFSSEYGKSLDEYLETIFLKLERLAEKGTYVNYRLWVESDESLQILKRLEDRYKVTISKNDKTKTLAKNIFYSKENAFIWPSERLEKGNHSPISGTCRGLKDQIAILVDGTVVPCCLDNNGEIFLGNIFCDDLKNIIESSMYQNMLLGFKNNQKIHPLCQKCNFYDSKL